MEMNRSSELVATSKVVEKIKKFKLRSRLSLGTQWLRSHDAQRAINQRIA